ncbi:MAG: prepilin-type N-terminal cleavage/methylation domain-containing protein, partial [Planctomycetes bacterium]|nr:prepilin-type N-terminal cleavage/methylation domain-containing protein [Planctomycetota bacterium]
MTTSRTTRTKARRRRPDAPGGRLGDVPAAKPPRARRGFTLLEIGLALAILVLLAAVAAVNFPAMRGSRTLEDGA